MTQAPPFISDKPPKTHSPGKKQLEAVGWSVAYFMYALIGFCVLVMLAYVPLEWMARLSGVALAAIAVFLGLICFKMK